MCGEGGFEQLSTDNKKWSKVAATMGFPSGKGFGSILRTHYENIVYPYDIVMARVKAATKSDQVIQTSVVI